MTLSGFKRKEGGKSRKGKKKKKKATKQNKPKDSRKRFTIEGEGNQGLQQGKRRRGARSCVSAQQLATASSQRPGSPGQARRPRNTSAKSPSPAVPRTRCYPAGPPTPPGPRDAAGSLRELGCNLPCPNRPGLICNSVFNLEIFI